MQGKWKFTVSGNWLVYSLGQTLGLQWLIIIKMYIPPSQRRLKWLTQNFKNKYTEKPKGTAIAALKNHRVEGIIESKIILNNLWKPDEGIRPSTNSRHIIVVTTSAEGSSKHGGHNRASGKSYKNPLKCSTEQADSYERNLTFRCTHNECSSASFEIIFPYNNLDYYYQDTILNILYILRLSLWAIWSPNHRYT